jgi:GNAT superfamily N-acetyltransferase
MGLIRFATVADIPALVELGKEIHAGTRLSALPYDEDKLASQFQAILEPQNESYCIFAAEVPGEGFVGALMGAVSECPFSDARMSSNYVYFVRSRYRGSSLAVRLLFAFRQWARNRDAMLFCISQNAGVDTGRFDKYMNHLGFACTGGNYSRWLNGLEEKTQSETISSGRIAVRPAGMPDIQAISALYGDMHAESPQSRIRMEQGRFISHLKAELERPRPEEVFLLAEEAGGKIAGFLSGHVTEYFFSRARIAMSHTFYLTPEHREGAAAGILLQGLQSWAEQRDCRELSLSLTSGIGTGPLDERILEAGFAFTGGNYIQWLMKKEGKGDGSTP